ncbi:MAG: hypothetical protein ACYCZX_02575, partial [Rhodospirillaceae bacterium]
MMSKPPKPQPQQRAFIAEALRRWAAQPVRSLNVRMIMWTGLAMIFIVIATRHDFRQALAVRAVAMVFMGVHGFLHVSFTNLLRYLQRQGIAEAEAALRTYLAPRRISNLDLAIA